MSKGERQSAHYDVLVVGSGFGGVVTALRLTEKGYRVGVLEAGRRFADDELPKTLGRAERTSGLPKLGLQGHPAHARAAAMSWCWPVRASAAGRSNYAQHALRARVGPFYEDPQWAHITDWREELAPYYDQAKRMLGVVPNPTMTPRRRSTSEVAEEMGVGDTFRLAPVGVFFGRDGDARSPAWKSTTPTSAAPARRRTAALECGECMTGCRHGAKNTLVKNYLYLAERAGAVVHPETTVTSVAAPSSAAVTPSRTVRSGAWLRPGVPHLHRRPGGLRRRHLGHPAPAAPACKRRRHSPGASPTGSAS